MQANKLAVDFKNKTKQTNSKKEGHEGEVPPLSKVSDFVVLIVTANYI